MPALILFLSVVLGSSLGLYLADKKALIKGLLRFSGAFLLGIVTLHIFPELFHQASHEKSHSLGLLILAGVFIQILLESITQGVEHGHVHASKKTGFPWGIFIGLTAHSFLEGVALSTPSLGLLWGIALHKIPIALVLSVFLRSYGASTRKQLLFLLLFALASPLGYWVGINSVSNTYGLYFLAVVSGIFLHVSTVILFESDKGHTWQWKKIGLLLLGFLLAWGITLNEIHPH